MDFNKNEIVYQSPFSRFYATSPGNYHTNLSDWHKEHIAELVQTCAWLYQFWAVHCETICLKYGRQESRKQSVGNRREISNEYAKKRIQINGNESKIYGFWEKNVF